mmetsp:Transcript_27590/g.66436  ORF Transcript_27590/g.66436 Transcript_27590/m.66436 type:complete len:207 (-) Transcript_27590:1200-1820(-)
MRPIVVDLPPPDGPTSATVFPLSIVRFRPSKIMLSGLVGYANLTFSNVTSPCVSSGLIPWRLDESIVYFGSVYVSSTSTSSPSSSTFVPTFFVTVVSPLPSLRSMAVIACAHAALAELSASMLFASWLMPCAANATPSMAPNTAGPLLLHVGMTSTAPLGSHQFSSTSVYMRYDPYRVRTAYSSMKDPSMEPFMKPILKTGRMPLL